MHGRGVFLSSKGVTLIGFWQNDKYIKTFKLDGFLTSFQKFVQGLSICDMMNIKEEILK